MWKKLINGLARTPLVQTLGGLTSILLLMFYEVRIPYLKLFLILISGPKPLARSSRNWQALLRTAAGLVPTLVDSLRTPPVDGMGQERDKVTLSHEVESAINFLLGFFISSDIITCVSTGSGPVLEINHLLALATLGINTESLIGCRNPVLALIFEISSLDRWKKETRNAGKLSIPDLAKHGGYIDKRLRQELAYINDIPTTRPL